MIGNSFCGRTRPHAFQLRKYHSLHHAEPHSNPENAEFPAWDGVVRNRASA